MYAKSCSELCHEILVHVLLVKSLSTCASKNLGLGLNPGLLLNDVCENNDGFLNSLYVYSCLMPHQQLRSYGDEATA